MADPGEYPSDQIDVSDFGPTYDSQRSMTEQVEERKRAAAKMSSKFLFDRKSK